MPDALGTYSGFSSLRRAARPDKPISTPFAAITCSSCEQGRCESCSALLEARFLLRGNASGRGTVCTHDCAGLGQPD